MATIGGVGFHLLLLLRWFLSSFLFLHLISGGSFCLLFRWLSLCLHTRRELREKKKEREKCHGAKSSHPSFSLSHSNSSFMAGRKGFKFRYIPSHFRGLPPSSNRRRRRLTPGVGVGEEDLELEEKGGREAPVRPRYLFSLAPGCHF